MQLHSTKNYHNRVGLKDAVLNALPSDNGLYVPVSIPKLDPDFFERITEYSFQEVAFRVAKSLLGDVIPVLKLKEIIDEAINFPAPVVSISEDLFIQELFHGPSLAFKDFGARFMARLMGYFNHGEDRELVILVATSGDTGGAVAAGFYDTPGVRVVILYPEGKVSELQELQLTTFGKNITAIKVDGTFDDCQKMVKTAFLDQSLKAKMRLTSANSINIARLIPQSFYYFDAYRQVKALDLGSEQVNFVVPSGNFGNIAAGILACRMGLPVNHFVAATNENDVFPAYLKSGIYKSRPSVRTLSNAMDVGNPSNFVRILDFVLGSHGVENPTDWRNVHHLNQLVKAYAFSDDQTKNMMYRIADQFGYVLDPHTAIGVLAKERYLQDYGNSAIPSVVLSTAHPIKFSKEIQASLPGHISIDVPEVVNTYFNKPVKVFSLSNSYSSFKAFLLDNV